MIIHSPKSSVARFNAGLLSVLLLLGGAPLEALQQHVVLVPRESPPEWLAPWLEAPWLEAPWLEADSWQGPWDRAAGAAASSWQGILRASTTFAGAVGSTGKAAAAALTAAAAAPAIPAVAAEAEEGTEFEAAVVGESSVDSGQRDRPLRRVERQARKAEAGSLPVLRSLESAVVATPPQAIAAASHAIAPEIVALSQSFDNSPAAIYAAVYHQIDYDPKWGGDSPRHQRLGRRRRTGGPDDAAEQPEGSRLKRWQPGLRSPEQAFRSSVFPAGGRSRSTRNGCNDRNG